MKTKKTLKSIIALALALILSLGVISTAFAANNGNIVWSVDGETPSCTYHSKLEVGTNTVTIEESDLYYFDLSELEDGYYSVKTEERFYEYICTPEKEDGKYVGWGEMELFNNLNGIIFNRNENVDILVVGAHCKADNAKIEVEYLGEGIEKVELDTKNEVLVDYDIHYYGTDEWGGNFDTKVTFSGGKTIEAEGVRYYFSFGGVPQRGENTVILSFAGYEFEQTLNIAFISDYISGVEAVIPEGTAGYIYYDYEYSLVSSIDEITVNFTDGTSQKIYNHQHPHTVTLPGGREIELDLIYDINPDTLKIYLNVYAGGYLIDAVEIDTEKASFAENAERFAERTRNNLEYIRLLGEILIKSLASGNFQTAEWYAGYLFNYIGTYFKSMINNINYFIKFMFA